MRNMQFTIIVINPKYGQLYYSLKKEIYEHIYIRQPSPF